MVFFYSMDGSSTIDPVNISYAPYVFIGFRSLLFVFFQSVYL